MSVADTTASRLLEIEGLRVQLGDPYRGVASQVLSDVRLSVSSGEIVGVIGETGSGKTTLGRTIVGLVRPVAGTVVFEGRDLTKLSRRRRRGERRAGSIQLVFQDSLRSLDPTLKIGESLTEMLAIRGAGRERRRAEATKALELVGLDPGLVDRYPGEVSGGQRQRISIARALVVHPKLVICDEPVSALDASTRGEILSMLGRLRDELGIAILLISHDLATMAGIADRVVVLETGTIVEEGPTVEVFANPQHPYTRMLLASRPQAVRDKWREPAAAADR